MIPRGAPYIGWSDLAAAVGYCLAPGDRASAARALEESWAPNTVAFLSVRSGLDALFTVLALPAGSEIIVTAITIPHILEIIAHHGLVAVPVDVNPETLEADVDDVRCAVTPLTRAILVAHLFGSRMSLDAIATVARERELMLVEDCAQVSDGSSYRGHATSDVSMFSFGPIKRQTAMGGGLLTFRDPALATRVRELQATYPVQANGAYLKRVLTMVAIKTVVWRPLFSAFVAVCRLTGRDHDRTLGTALRGFAHGDLITRLRHQPSAPLLRTLHRRLGQRAQPEIDARVAVVRAVTTEWPDMPRAGSRASYHTHWQFPMRAAGADALMHKLWDAGYDATRGASNLCSVPAPAGRPAPAMAERFMDEILYLPLCPTATADEMRAMARTIRGFAETKALGSVNRSMRAGA